MFFNYMKIAIRNLARDKTNTLINLLGLSMGISACLILLLYVRYELSYDSFNENHERILRVDTQMSFGDMDNRIARSTPTVGSILVQEFPELEAYTTFFIREETLVEYANVRNFEASIAEARRDIFELFSYDILHGSVDYLNGFPQAIAVSRSFAERYATLNGSSESASTATIVDFLGEALEIDDELYTVGLIFEDLPGNAHWDYDALLFLEAAGDAVHPAPGRIMIRDTSYVLATEPLSQSRLNTIASQYNEKYLAGFPMAIDFTALDDIHLYDPASGGPPGGSIAFVLIMSAAAFFLVFIASVNYINLAIARSLGRTQEIAMRKVLGANREQLITQFLGESFLLIFLAVLIALVLSQLAVTFLPLQQWLNAELGFDLLLEPSLLLTLIAGACTIALLTGLYPALYLSAIKPASAFRNLRIKGSLAYYLSQGFMLIQFIVSIIALASALLMTVQYRYMTGKDMGFVAENLLSIPLRNENLVLQSDSLINTLNASGVVESSGITFRPPYGTGGTIIAGRVENGEGVMQEGSYSFNRIGRGYLETLGVDLLEGDYFDAEASSDSNIRYIVNEAMVRQLAWAEPLGKELNLANSPGQVVGVVRDFHFDSVEREIEPVVMAPFSNLSDDLTQMPGRQTLAHLMVRPREGSMQEALDYLSELWPQFDSENPFTYEVVEEEILATYQPEKYQIYLISALALLCIVIATMGLYGLTSFKISQKSKEISMRKILGGSIASIMLLLYRQVIALVAFASSLGIPVAWYLFQQWMESFAYQANINPALLVVPAPLVLLFALATVSKQCFRVAAANPAAYLNRSSE